MSRGDDRRHIQQRINELEAMAASNWGSPSLLFEIFTELEFRKPRKRPRELKQRINDRLLELAADFYFTWPSTSAPGGDGNLDGAGWPRTGLLSYLGYHVGRTGLPTTTRRAILADAYLGNLPTVNNPVYMADWGDPVCGPRLRKIAESLAAFCRNQKRKDGPHFQSAAVADWESDLAYLKGTYYDGVYDFPWPRT
jgi:hypothetical protein